jgi:signal transduction histidine kinase
MDAKAPITAGVGALKPTWVDVRPDQRWTRPLTVVVVGFVVLTAFQTAPVPGVHGQHLRVLIALIGIAVGTVGLLRLSRATPTMHLALLILIVLSSATLVGLQPNGPGFFGVFPAVAAAAFTLPVRQSALVAGLAVVALATGWALEGDRPVFAVVLNELGVVAFYLVTVFARRLREANQQAQQLIVELEETRAAQTQAAALGERQRLAREMHDVLAHSLSGLVLNLEGARLLAERSGADPEVGDAIERAHRLAKTGLEEARRAIGMLRDDALPGPERLAGLAAEFERDTGVPCLLTLTGLDEGLSPDSRLTLYRVAQEALTNVRKHSRPDRVELLLVHEAGGIRLRVEDFKADGDRPPAGDGTGYGLTGMRERAELLGGTLTARPTREGFRVELWVPK